MNLFNMIEGVLMPILKSLLSQYTTSKAPQQILDGLQAAIDGLNKVRDTPVTRDQLEALMVTVPWDKQP